MNEDTNTTYDVDDDAISPMEDHLQDVFDRWLAGQDWED